MGLEQRLHSIGGAVDQLADELDGLGVSVDPRLKRDELSRIQPASSWGHCSAHPAFARVDAVA